MTTRQTASLSKTVVPASPVRNTTPWRVASSVSNRISGGPLSRARLAQLASSSTPPSPETIQRLQRGIGNRATTQLLQAQTANSDTETVVPPRSINRTGLPDRLKAGVEALSGISLDNVRVHRNSSKPAQLNALAYAQGTDIHLAPGQEQHLPHEAWHVVQQAQGRVRPTIQMAGGVNINDDKGLEHEADLMGIKAVMSKLMQAKNAPVSTQSTVARPTQRKPKDIRQEHELKLDRQGQIQNVEADRVDPPVSYPMNTLIALNIIRHAEVLGGHLFKREYGGFDNYSNVVTWSGRSEQAFTKFEKDYLDRAHDVALEAGKMVTFKVKTQASFGDVNVTQSDLFTNVQPQGRAEKTARYKVWKLTKLSLETVPTSVTVSVDGLAPATSFSRPGSRMLDSKVTPSPQQAQQQVTNIINGDADERIARSLKRLGER